LLSGQRKRESSPRPFRRILDSPSVSQATSSSSRSSSSSRTFVVVVVVVVEVVVKKEVVTVVDVVDVAFLVDAGAVVVVVVVDVAFLVEAGVVVLVRVVVEDGSELSFRIIVAQLSLLVQFCDPTSRKLKMSPFSSAAAASLTTGLQLTMLRSNHNNSKTILLDLEIMM
jgi:hypothetical protein